MVSWVDLTAAIAYLGVSVGVALWMGRGNKNIDDYLLGGRDIAWWALLGSIVATETSTVTFLSVPGLSFKAGGDLRYLQLAAGYIVGRVLVAVLLLPAYFQGEVLTAYQLLETRFGTATRRVASVMFLIARNLGDGLRLYLAALALKAAVGLPLTICIVVTGGVTIAYTLFGGLRSVVWSDCIQLVVYLAAAASSLWIIVHQLPGGWVEFKQFGMDSGRFRLVDAHWSLADPYTLWAGLIGGAFLSLGTHGVDQIIVQRSLAARSRADAARAIVASGILVTAQFTLFLMIGVGLAAIRAHVHSDFNPGAPDSAYATFIVSYLPRGLVGLTLAGVFAATMSTLSSSLNASASTVIGDLGDLLNVSQLSTAQSITLSRAATFLFGVVQMLVAAVAAAILAQSVIDRALAIAGWTFGILLGVFFLGRLRSVHERGALAGMAAGLVALSSIAHWVAWPWYAVIGSLTTLASGWLASRLISPSTRPLIARSTI